MSLANDLKEFTAGFASSYKMFTDADYSRARTEHLKQQTEDLKGPSEEYLRDAEKNIGARTGSGAIPVQGGGAGGDTGGTERSFGDADMDAAGKGIRKIESGSPEGNYGALGKVITRKDGSQDQALGAYQVMRSNVPSWTAKHYGKELTPDEFIKNREAQDAVFKGEFGGYLRKYGPQGAANMWFSGSPEVSNKKDANNTTVASYGSQFAKLYTGFGGGAGTSAGSERAASAQTPAATSDTQVAAAPGGQQAGIDFDKLKGVNPQLIQVAQTAQKNNPGLFAINPKTEQLRTQEQQDEYVRKGWSQTRNSPHLAGNALDLVPINPKTGQADPDYKEGYANITKAMRDAAAQHKITNLEWGGDWKNFKDLPHWQIGGATYDVRKPQPSTAQQPSQQPATTAAAKPQKQAFAQPQPQPATDQQPLPDQGGFQTAAYEPPDEEDQQLNTGFAQSGGAIPDPTAQSKFNAGTMRSYTQEPAGQSAPVQAGASQVGGAGFVPRRVGQAPVGQTTGAIPTPAGTGFGVGQVTPGQQAFRDRHAAQAAAAAAAAQAPAAAQPLPKGNQWDPKYGNQPDVPGYDTPWGGHQAGVTKEQLDAMPDAAFSGNPQAFAATHPGTENYVRWRVGEDAWARGQQQQAQWNRGGRESGYARGGLVRSYAGGGSVDDEPYPDDLPEDMPPDTAPAPPPERPPLRREGDPTPGGDLRAGARWLGDKLGWNKPAVPVPGSPEETGAAPGPGAAPGRQRTPFPGEPDNDDQPDPNVAEHTPTHKFMARAPDGGKTEPVGKGKGEKPKKGALPEHPPEPPRPPGEVAQRIPDEYGVSVEKLPKTDDTETGSIKGDTSKAGAKSPQEPPPRPAMPDDDKGRSVLDKRTGVVGADENATVTEVPIGKAKPPSVLDKRTTNVGQQGNDPQPELVSTESPMQGPPIPPDLGKHPGEVQTGAIPAKKPVPKPVAKPAAPPPRAAPPRQREELLVSDQEIKANHLTNDQITELNEARKAAQRIQGKTGGDVQQWGNRAIYPSQPASRQGQPSGAPMPRGADAGQGRALAAPTAVPTPDVGNANNPLLRGSQGQGQTAGRMVNLSQASHPMLQRPVDPVGAGLKYIQNAFGLGKQAGAVPAPGDAAAQQASTRQLANGVGAATFDDVKTIDETIDPQRQIPPEARQLARLNATYEYWLAKGRPDKAQKTAASLIQYGNLAAQKLGGMAMGAMSTYQKSRDPKDLDNALKFISGAYSMVPDGNKLVANPQPDGNVKIQQVDANGKVVYDGIVNPADIAGFAAGIANGSEYWHRMTNVADPTQAHAEAAAARTQATKQEERQFQEKRYAERTQERRGYQEQLYTQRHGKGAGPEDENAIATARSAADKARDDYLAANERNPDAPETKAARERYNRTASDLYYALPQKDRDLRMNRMGHEAKKYALQPRAEKPADTSAITKQYPDAKQAPNGKWYVKQGAGWAEVVAQ